eukprot:GHVP01064659.1.p1 GENE.GHVP01064659.1~~GHVP01064659.1.p1  ORF type:complete len:149 (-),score=47.66 GHVP01064659.1:151-597(-)
MKGGYEKAYEVVYPRNTLLDEEVFDLQLKEIGMNDVEDIYFSNNHYDQVEETVAYKGEDVDDELEVYLNEEIKDVSRTLDSDYEENLSEIEDNFIEIVGEKENINEIINPKKELIENLSQMSITSSTTNRSESMRKLDKTFGDFMNGF